MGVSIETWNSVQAVVGALSQLPANDGQWFDLEVCTGLVATYQGIADAADLMAGKVKDKDLKAAVKRVGDDAAKQVRLLTLWRQAWEKAQKPAVVG